MTVSLSGHGHDGRTEAGDDGNRAGDHCAELFVLAFDFTGVDADVVEGGVAVVDWVV